MGGYVSYEEYAKTINSGESAALEKMAAELAARLLERGIRGDKPVIEQSGIRNVTVPKKFLGITVGSNTIQESYQKVILRGWNIADKNQIMGESDGEYYKFTLHLLLGEDGRLYQRMEEYTQRLSGSYSQSTVWKSAQKLNIIDFDLQQEDGAYRFPFGDTVREALNNFNCNF